MMEREKSPFHSCPILPAPTPTPLGHHCEMSLEILVSRGLLGRDMHINAYHTYIYTDSYVYLHVFPAIIAIHTVLPLS